MAVQLALSTAQRNKGGMISASRTMTRRVSAVSNGVANRLRRIQPIGPERSVSGGAMGINSVAMAQRSTSAMRALYQFMKYEVIRLSVR